MRRIVAGLVGLSVSLAACSAPPPPTATACGSPTALLPDPVTPELTGAPIGPLLIRGPYPAGATNATALGFVPGKPFKMIVLVARDMDTDVALTGTRCSDGLPLRFWLNKGGPAGDDVMTAYGDLRAMLPKTQAGGAYVGYLLFPTSDSYRIEGFVGERKLGEVTVAISAEPYPAGSNAGRATSESGSTTCRPAAFGCPVRDADINHLD